MNDLPTHAAWKTKETQFDLVHGNCVTEMSQLSADSVDIVVTSPPYNLGTKYGKYDDAQARSKYLAWSLKWASQIQRLLRYDGSFFLNVGSSPSNPLLPHQLVLEMSKLFVVQNTFHWIKSITVVSKDGEPLSVGHFKPIISHRFVTDCHEYVFHLTKTGNTSIDRLSIGVPYSDKSNIKRWAHTNGGDKRCRGNNWFIPYKTIHNRNEQRPHPATFPVELAVNCIKLHGNGPDMVMLDPFLGIGHSAIAAKRCGIGRFYGFDIDPEYVENARKAVNRE